MFEVTRLRSKVFSLEKTLVLTSFWKGTIFWGGMGGVNIVFCFGPRLGLKFRPKLNNIKNIEFEWWVGWVGGVCTVLFVSNLQLQLRLGCN